MNLLAAWIMDRLVSDGSSPWAIAMRREYDELEHGHFGWAVGCLRVAIVSDIRTNWLFHFCILAAAYFLVFEYSTIVFKLAVYDRAFVTAHFYKLFIFAPVPFALVLGYWRPNRAMTITFFGGFVAHGLGSTLLIMHRTGGSFYSWWIEALWNDMLPVYLGQLVECGVWYAAALAGAKLRYWQRDLRDRTGRAA